MFMVLHYNGVAIVYLFTLDKYVIIHQIATLLLVFTASC